MEWKPKILILGPGGAKGFLELGALTFLERENCLDDVTTFVGVSVGALISLLLCSGYSSLEILSIALETDLFQDISSIDISKIQANIGLISNKPIKDRLHHAILSKFGIIPNLDQLFMATGRELHCVSVNLDDKQVEYISRHNQPRISCIDAVMLSMNIPLFFYRLEYKGKIYIDGAFGDPCPLLPFDDNNTPILALYITTKILSENIRADSSIYRYIYEIIDTILTLLRNRSICNASDQCKFIELTGTAIDPLGITMSFAEKSSMVLEGYKVAKKFVDSMNKPEEFIEEEVDDTSEEEEPVQRISVSKVSYHKEKKTKINPKEEIYIAK